MLSPVQLSGEPRRLLWALPGTWETLDNLVNEGPFVVNYRDRYYIIYNANHTSRQFGNYALGVAEAPHPLAFSNETKYPFPVLRSNRDARYLGEHKDDSRPEVKNCGQPNLVRGPNGFEWWLVYFADHERRSQCIDRVHFFGQELFIEGPTIKGEAGYHPVPAMPLFRDLFDDHEVSNGQWQWSGDWCVESESLRVEAGPLAAAHARAPEAAHYLVETALRLQEETSGRIGLVAWQDGNGKALHAGLDRSENRWYWAFLSENGESIQSAPLPADFTWSGFHEIRVENNAGRFSALLDGIEQPFFEIRPDSYAVGTPGLFAKGCRAEFHSFIATRGWDDWGDGIRGWTDREGNGVASGGRMPLAPDEMVFKGDRLPCYDFSVQLSAEATWTVYPVYVDENNYLEVTSYAALDVLRIAGKREGQELPERRVPIVPRLHRAHAPASNGNNLRFVKLADRVIIFVEGRETAQVEGKWPASCVALSADSGEATLYTTNLHELR